MKQCPCCGHRDNPYWRHSRFDYNADYMSWEDFQREYKAVAFQLSDKPTGTAYPYGTDVYYRRGTNGLQVYRVAIEDYKMPRERKHHGQKEASKP